MLFLSIAVICCSLLPQTGGLASRILSQILAKPQRFLIRPASGWADLAFEETKRILLDRLQPYKFSPECSLEEGLVVVQNCDYRQGLELLTRSTVAYDIEWVLHSSRVTSRNDWNQFFEKSGLKELVDFSKVECRISALVTHPVVGTAKEIKKMAETYLGIESHDPAIDPSPESSFQNIRLDCSKNRSRILLSLAGCPLFKRSYKRTDLGATAPLPEHLSAACFRWSLDVLKIDLSILRHPQKCVLGVPFAGSGTAGFEAILQVANVAPGLLRSNYACESFNVHPQATMATLKKRLFAKVESFDSQIQFGDINEGVLQSLEKQVSSFQKHLAFDVKAKIVQNDFLKNSVAWKSNADRLFLPLNPPYGERLASKTGSVAIYGELGHALNRLARIQNICGYVICPDEMACRAIMNDLSRFENHTRHFTHGGRDVRLVAFDSSARNSGTQC